MNMQASARESISVYLLTSSSVAQLAQLQPHVIYFRVIFSSLPWSPFFLFPEQEIKKKIIDKNAVIFIYHFSIFLLIPFLYLQIGHSGVPEHSFIKLRNSLLFFSSRYRMTKSLGVSPFLFA